MRQTLAVLATSATFFSSITFAAQPQGGLDRSVLPIAER